MNTNNNSLIRDSNVSENLFQVLASTTESNVFNASHFSKYFNSTERVMAAFDMPDSGQRDKIHCIFAPVRSILFVTTVLCHLIRSICIYQVSININQ